jgi:hypothetical protein
VREAAEVRHVGEAVATGLQPLVAAGSYHEAVAFRDRPDRRFEQREPPLDRSDLVARDLGDAAGVRAAGPGQSTEGEPAGREAAEAGIEAMRQALAQMSGLAAGWFTLGRLTWTSGANADRTAEVASHDVVAGERRFTLLEAPVRPIVLGDAFVVVAGCDKRVETCRDRFANVVNFRGFPHIPGQDTVIRYPNRGDANSGDVL